MTRNNGYKHPFSGNAKPQPFDSAEEVWFWFIMAQQARNEGARFSAGAGMIPRPCEPLDILKILDSLYRQRRLQRDHLLVLRHYGRRNMPPRSAPRAGGSRVSSLGGGIGAHGACAFSKRDYHP